MICNGDVTSFSHNHCILYKVYEYKFKWSRNGAELKLQIGILHKSIACSFTIFFFPCVSKWKTFYFANILKNFKNVSFPIFKSIAELQQYHWQTIWNHTFVWSDNEMGIHVNIERGNNKAIIMNWNGNTWNGIRLLHLSLCVWPNWQHSSAWEVYKGQPFMCSQF